MNGVRSITERGSHVFALHQIQYKFTFVREPLVKRFGKPAVLVREEETMPEKTHDDPPNSTSFSPLTIWWKSMTRHARSGMKNLSMQSCPIRHQLVEPGNLFRQVLPFEVALGVYQVRSMAANDEPSFGPWSGEREDMSLPWTVFGEQ